MLFRLIALALLLVLTLTPTRYLNVFKRPDIQFVAATFTVLVLVVYDVYAGLVLSLGLVVLYFRLYRQDVAFLDTQDVRSKGPMANLVGKYLTPEHLQRAQDNVVDKADFDTEIVGIKGVYGEPVYGAQGLDNSMPGLEKPKTLSGSSFEL
jgi:membrane protein implicated in regulation of membrane protease activity